MRTRRELLGLGCCRTPSSATPPTPRRALRGFSCMPPNPSRALPVFPCSPPNPRRAVPPIPCSWYHLCRALRPIPCRPPCTSPDSLQGPHFVQGFWGSARRKARRTSVSACTSAIFLRSGVRFACFLPRVRVDARIWGKCTSSCKDLGEVHVPVQESRGSARPRAGIKGKCTSQLACRIRISPCTSPEMLQVAVRLARFSAAGRILVVHFAQFLAGAPFRARKVGKCMAARPPPARPLAHPPNRCKPAQGPNPYRAVRPARLTERLAG